MIGSAAGLSFTDFITNTGVAVLFVLAATIVCFYFIYGRKLHVEPEAWTPFCSWMRTKPLRTAVC